MLQVTPQMRILVALDPTDFRKGIDGIAQLCRGELAADPFAGAVFVFRNRRRTAIKILVYDGRGFWLCHRRLSKGKFNWWPTRSRGRAARLEAHQLAVLCCAGDPEGVEVAPVWRRVTPVDRDEAEPHIGTEQRVHKTKKSERKDQHSRSTIDP